VKSLQRAAVLAFVASALVPAAAAAVPPDTTPPTCVPAVNGTTMTIVVQDTGSGLVAPLVVDGSNDSSTNVPVFTTGSTAPQTVLTSQGSPDIPAWIGFTAFDVAGNSTECFVAIVSAQTLCTLIRSTVGFNAAGRGLFARLLGSSLASGACGAIGSPAGLRARLAVLRAFGLLSADDVREMLQLQRFLLA
jgi:hypothetical protein